MAKRKRPMPILRASVPSGSTLADHETLTMSELQERANALPAFATSKPSDWQVNHETNSWVGGMTMSEAVQSLADGWKTAPALHHVSIASIPSASESETYLYDVAGDILDVAAFVSGEPEHFLYSVPEETKNGKLLRLSVETGGAGAVDAIELDNRAQAIASLVHALELAGYSLHITVTRAYTLNNDRGNRVFSFAFPIKEHSQILNENRFQFMLSSAFFRRILIGFRSMKANNNSDSHPASYRPADSHIHFAYSDGLSYSLETAVETITRLGMSQLGNV